MIVILIILKNAVHSSNVNHRWPPGLWEGKCRSQIIIMIINVLKWINALIFKILIS